MLMKQQNSPIKRRHCDILKEQIFHCSVAFVHTNSLAKLFMGYVADSFSSHDCYARDISLCKPINTICNSICTQTLCLECPSGIWYCINLDFTTGPLVWTIHNVSYSGDLVLWSASGKFPVCDLCVLSFALDRHSSCCFCLCFYCELRHFKVILFSASDSM